MVAGNLMRTTLSNSGLWYDAVDPEVSIIVLNLENAELTRKCMEYVSSHTCGRRYEVIVVDNGSSADDFRALAELEEDFRIIRLSANRFFGEGNNIGAERSKGKYLVFLNNDAFVTEGWLSPLIDLLERDDTVGGVGPRFLYPDGRLQEAGAFIDEDGVAVQVGKFSIYDENDLSKYRVVDYCSAACFAVRRDIFDRVAGFDHIYEPLYYEDADLCFRIASLGKHIYYCPDSTVYHIENATSSEQRVKLSLNNIVELSKATFLSRWGEWLSARSANRNRPHIREFSVPANAPRSSSASLRNIVFYSPYELIAGGGERYILSAAAAVSEGHHVYVATEESYSRHRLTALARQLSLDLSRIELIKRNEIPLLGEVEWSVMIGNEVIPAFPGFGKRNVYVCQFPFPLDRADLAARWGNGDRIEKIVVYSNFAKEHFVALQQRLKIAQKDLQVIFPPVTPVPIKAGPKNGPMKVTLIGRFFCGGHNKRHDVAIDAVRKLVERGLSVELNLVGSVHAGAEHRTHLEWLKERARGLPVIFHTNLSREGIERVLGESQLYWHATGFGVDDAVHPEKCEHFGISILEAMSAGCVPLVCRNGGPIEFVTEQVNGFHYGSLDELVEKSHLLLERPDMLKALGGTARGAAAKYSQEAFDARWRELLE